MRYVNVGMCGLLFGVLSMASCTCHKDVGSPTFQEPPSGFHSAQSETKPGLHVKAPTVTPAKAAPEEVAAAGTPTPAANLPADFPKEVPVYKDAAVSNVQDLANNAHNVVFSTSAPVAEVSDFYQTTMTRQGWKVTQEFHRAEHAFMTFEKGQMVANVTVSVDARNPGKQMIAIMYEERKPLEFDEF